MTARAHSPRAVGEETALREHAHISLACPGQERGCHEMSPESKGRPGQEAAESLHPLAVDASGVGGLVGISRSLVCKLDAEPRVVRQVVANTDVVLVGRRYSAGAVIAHDWWLCVPGGMIDNLLATGAVRFETRAA